MRVKRYSASGHLNGFAYGKEWAQWLRWALKHHDPMRWVARAKKGDDPHFLKDALEWPREEFLRLGVEEFRSGLQMEPDLSRYPELRGMKQYIQDEIRGAAEGSGLSEDEIIWLRSITRVHQRLHTGLVGSRACTTIVFADGPQGPVIGRNTDADLECAPQDPPAYDSALHLNAPERGYSHVDVGLNEKGLAMFGSGTAYQREPDSDERFPVSVGDLVMRFCSSVAEAVELIKRYAGFGFASNIALLDAKGAAAAVEKSKRTCAVRYAEDGYVFTTDYVAIEPETRKLQDPHSEAYRFHKARHDRIDALIRESGRDRTPQRMWRILRDHNAESPVCKHLDRLPRFYQLGTLWSLVIRPQVGQFAVAEIQKDPLRYPCELEPVERWWTFDPLRHRSAGGEIW